MQWIVVFAALVTAACTGPRQLPLTPGPDTCNAMAYQHLLGQPRAAADGLPQPKRVYHITDMITMDHRPDRLNVILDDSGTIGEISCG